MKFLRIGAMALTVGLLLSACGGGGNSSGTPMGMVPEPTIPMPQQMTPQTAFSGNQMRGGTMANPLGGSLADLIRRASGPVFGSVAQNFHSPRLAAVRSIETSFTGNRFTLHVSRHNGSSFSLDTNRDNVFDVVTYDPSENPVANRPAIDGTIVGRDVTAGVAVEWSNTDFTDYVAGGYWMYVDDALNFEIGAFIDGPAFEDVAISLPLTGLATYTGQAGGLYVGIAGVDQIAPTGTIENGQYQGRIHLSANFDRNSITGLINNVGVYNVSGLLPNGQTYFQPNLISTSYRVHLGSVPISQSGTFAGSGVRVTNPTQNITDSIGSWGGRFSNVNDADGNPRAVAGTNAAYMATSGGSEAIFTGAFYGATERFE